MKGYNLSTDYKKLWDLIHDGHRIPAWILYSDEYKEPIYDIVEVKLLYGTDNYNIGYRGQSYGHWDNDFEGFEKVCEGLELRYIKPKED